MLNLNEAFASGRSVVSRFAKLASPRIFDVGIVLATIGLIQCSYWIAHVERTGLPDICVAWDQTAQRTLAPLMHQQKVGTDRSLIEALAALRRARRQCAAGRLDLARRDYDTLHRLFGPPPSAIAEE